MPLAFLERAGYRPATLDLAIEALDLEKVGRAHVVAISVPMHTAMRIGIQLARRVRESNPKAHICFHGLYAPLNADLLRDAVADSLLGGECEEALVGLVQRLEIASESSAASGTSIRATAPDLALRKLDFPVPNRAALLPFERYAQLEDANGRRLAGYVETTRGCLHHCRHCPIPAVYEGRFFAIPVPVVLEDVRRQIAAGATHLTIGDADFLNGPVHAQRVVAAIHAEFPRLTFDFTAKIEHLLDHRTLLPDLAAAGAMFVVTAVESLSDEVLAHLDKGHTRADVDVALALLRRVGITMRPSFMPFTPWATFDDYFELLDWVESEDLIDCVDPVQLTIRLLVPPGSLLLASPAMQPHLGPLDEAALSYQWTHPDPRMDVLQHEAARLVEHVATHREDARVTFQRLRRLAAAIREDDANAPVEAAESRRERVRAPRLTEPWFC